jgi:hypothetical protein
LSSIWAILKITNQKKTDYIESGNLESNQIYFEMCDLNGKKVAGAITIPIPNNSEIANFRSVILSTLEPEMIAEVLQKAGIKL